MITQEDFDRILWELVSNSVSTDELFAMPGLYEIVSEALNNEVLEAWELEQAEGEEAELENQVDRTKRNSF